MNSSLQDIVQHRAGIGNIQKPSERLHSSFSQRQLLAVPRKILPPNEKIHSPGGKIHRTHLQPKGRTEGKQSVIICFDNWIKS